MLVTSDREQKDSNSETEKVFFDPLRKFVLNQLARIERPGTRYEQTAVEVTTMVIWMVAIDARDRRRNEMTTCLRAIASNYGLSAKYKRSLHFTVIYTSLTVIIH